MSLTPEGKYTAVVVPVEQEDDGTHKVRWGEAETGTKQCLLYFKIVEGDHTGRVEPWFGYWTPDAWKRSMEALRYCGFTGDDLMDADNQPLDQKVQIVVEHNTPPGKDTAYARVAFVNKTGSGTIKMKKPMSPNDLRTFAAQMKSYANQVPAVEGERVTGVDAEPPPPAASDDGSPPPPDDDIPF